jgi:hypothetical protein
MRRNFWTRSTKAFVKFDTIEFDENFKQARQTRSGRDFLDVNMVSASVIIGGKYRGAHFPATEISPCAANGGENMLAAALALPNGRRGRSALAFA